MAIDPFSAAIGKAALSAGAKPALSKLRVQIARRGADIANLSTLGGAERELDEALAVLSGAAESLPASVTLKLKGLLSQRPSVFADADAKHFIADERVIALAKSGARKTFANEEISEERAEARIIHAELFEGDGIFGERLLEDAVQFAALTLLAHLTPGDRFVIEFINEKQNEVLQELHHISDQISELKGRNARGSPSVDVSVLDRAVLGEVRKLRRQRFVHGEHLVSKAEQLGLRLKDGLQLASDEARAAVAAPRPARGIIRTILPNVNIRVLRRRVLRARRARSRSLVES